MEMTVEMMAVAKPKLIVTSKMADSKDRSDSVGTKHKLLMPSRTMPFEQKRPAVLNCMQKYLTLFFNFVYTV